MCACLCEKECVGGRGGRAARQRERARAANQEPPKRCVGGGTGAPAAGHHAAPSVRPDLAVRPSLHRPGVCGRGCVDSPGGWGREERGEGGGATGRERGADRPAGAHARPRARRVPVPLVQVCIGTQAKQHLTELGMAGCGKPERQQVGRGRGGWTCVRRRRRLLPPLSSSFPARARRAAPSPAPALAGSVETGSGPKVSPLQKKTDHGLLVWRERVQRRTNRRVWGGGREGGACSQPARPLSHLTRPSPLSPLSPRRPVPRRHPPHVGAGPPVAQRRQSAGAVHAGRPAPRVHARVRVARVMPFHPGGPATGRGGTGGGGAARHRQGRLQVGQGDALLCWELSERRPLRVKARAC